MKKSLLMMLMCVVGLLTLSGMSVAEDELLKPYVLASVGASSLDKKTGEVKAAVGQHGFQVVGEYSPYKGAHIIVVTSDALKKNAAKSDFGAYGAIVRISLTEKKGGDIEVAYTNPLYYAQAYRMKDPLSGVAASLEKALGKKSVFGSQKGLKASKLRSYHYMVMMPYFDDQVSLGSFASQEEALKAVEANLAARKGGSSKVYRVDLPDKKESVFGVSITEGDGADRTIMPVIDSGDPKHTAHLPYEMVVTGGKVYMLHGKFRIALDFPDLTMGTFMKISGAPSAIEERLKQIAAGK
ncbi:MAG: hypothetical protein EHM54_04885 [Nitrospiraceae bacterium]|nr:MAG: hypothetical protein EHM54_04885 [Nitrospiraceae bacterium]